MANVAAGARCGPGNNGRVLDQILDSVRLRLPQVVAAAADLRAAANDYKPLSFIEPLSLPGLSVIAEIKRRSPSAGPLNETLDPASQARRYVMGGAAAISVLTEPDHFGGSLDDLRAVREVVDVPLLRKDFVLHPAQIWEAREAGADAVLLIVAALDDAALSSLIAEASMARLEPLVEVHDQPEFERARAAGATLIGVNNRDLTTFDTDLAIAERLAPLLGGGIVSIAESGVSDPAGARRMAAAGYDAILVGQALVTSNDPAQLLAALRGDVA